MEIWLTGYGVVSPLGARSERRNRLELGERAALADVYGYPVYPVRDFDHSKYVKGRTDARQMGPLMLYAAVAAAEALESAGLDQDPEALSRLNICVAADGGERDAETDEATMRASRLPDADRLMNEAMMRARPSLFLSQMPNLIPSNICITRNFAAPSRTLLGPEPISVEALRTAMARIRSGQCKAFLLGGSKNGECVNSLIHMSGRGLLAAHPGESLWTQQKGEDGFCLASGAAFVVVESAEHAVARGARGLARLAAVDTSFAPREDGDLCERRLLERFGAAHPNPVGEMGVISGISGLRDVTRRERAFLAGVESAGTRLSVRAPAVLHGHSMEASFFVNLVLAIECLERGKLFGPLDKAEPLEARSLGGPLQSVLVTSWGSTDAEGFARLETCS